MISRYVVRIGDDTFHVDAYDNQEARYKAAQLFKEKYQLDVWLTEIATHAKTRLIPDAPTPTETTVQILSKLRETPCS